MLLEASCHCGAVVLEVSRKPRKLTQCNCSICRRYGALWAYYGPGSVRVRSGRRSIAVYRARGRTRGFHRCRTCGCVMFHQRRAGGGMAVNARNFDPDAVATISIRMLDGASTWKVLDEYVQPELFRSPA